MTLIKKEETEKFLKAVRPEGLPSIDLPELTVYIGHKVTHWHRLADNMEKGIKSFKAELLFNTRSGSPECKSYLYETLLILKKYLDDVQLNFDAFERLNKDGEFKETYSKLSICLEINRGVLEEAITEVSQKLLVFTGPELFTTLTHNHEALPPLKNKIKSKLNKVNFTTLLWLLAETELLDFGGNRQVFVKFVENNCQFYDAGKKQFFDMKDISPLISKFYNTSSGETNPKDYRNFLIELLSKLNIPPDKPVLLSNKHKKH